MILELFWSMFQIGLFSIGGGYVALPLIQEQIVSIHHWLSITEFMDIITIAEMTPGPIAINAATFVGMRIEGIGMAIVSTMGVVFAPCIIVLLLAKLYYKYRTLQTVKDILEGLRPAVVAMIASAGLSIVILAFGGEAGMTQGLAGINWIAVGIFTVGLISLRKWKVNPILMLLGSGLAGLLLYSFQ